MKTVVVDFSNLDDLSGFGEIARNYAPRLAETAKGIADMHFLFILPDKHIGEFGQHVDYVGNNTMRKTIGQYRQDIALWHSTHQQLGFRLRGKGIVQLLTVHDLNYLHEKHGIHLLRHKIRTPWLIRRSDCVTVISGYVKNDVEQHIPFLDKEPIVIYNGICDVERLPLERPSFASDSDRYFLCMGHIREKKNVHTLVPMMKYFPKHKLFICGANNWPYADRIRAMIAPEDRERILLPGNVSDAEKCWLYAHADAFLFPSRLEGFGIPVLEAMRFGMKVIASRYTCLPEVCDRHASYWDSYEPEAMAKVVADGIAGWDRQGPEAQAATAHSRSFNYDRYTKEYVSLYRKLLGL